MGAKLTTKEFVEKSKIIHGNKYDYSYTTYNSRKEKVKIICPEHGEFNQYPGNHLSGNNCPNCSHNLKHTTKSFINSAKKIHGYKYNYSNTDYKNNKSKVKIICPIHGIFEQRAGAHISKNRPHGCPACDKSQKLKTEEFIEMANKIHSNKYSYEKTTYKSARDKVIIICKIHGEFEQLAKVHIHNKCGCPKCFESKGEIDIKNWLIKNNISFLTQHKFHDCKNINYLLFDFYLPEYNMCIEYDGRQHFEAIDYFGGEKTLKSIKKRDNIKNKYCKENNIKLLRIKYNQDIDLILEELLISF